MEYPINTEQTTRLLKVHHECGVTLQHSVALLFRTKRLSLRRLAKQVGCQRTYLYKALAGSLEPPLALRAAMADVLGVDPWMIYGLEKGSSPEIGNGLAATGETCSDGQSLAEGQAPSNTTASLGLNFLNWAAAGVRSGDIPCNNPGSRIHVVPEGLLLVCPGIFKDYAALTHAGDFKAVQRSFLKLKLHQATTAGLNVHCYSITGHRSILYGLLLPYPSIVFGDGAMPVPNPLLRLIKSTQEKSAEAVLLRLAKVGAVPTLEI